MRVLFSCRPFHQTAAVWQNKTGGFLAELFTQRMRGNWKSAMLEINYRKGMFYMAISQEIVNLTIVK